MMSENRVAKISQSFAAEFGRKPQYVVRAPGRVNLIGEHTDYNGGKVLPMAIDRHTYMAAGQAKTDVTRIRSSLKPDVVSLDRAFGLLDGDASWVSYMRGVLTLWPHSVGALDIFVDSNIPMGAGLSSSAALEVATLKLCEAVSGRSMSILEAAKICQQAENDFAGVPCGIMDQVASLAGKKGHGVLFDCARLKISHVPLEQQFLAFVIIDSLTTHQLADGAYAQRRQQCEEVAARFGVVHLCEVKLHELEASRDMLPAVLFRRARHVVTENERVSQFVEAIVKKQYGRAGQLLYQSHASLRDDFEVSTSELDLLVGIAQSVGQAGGVYGCRMTGGGFGGAVITLVEASLAKFVADHLADQYHKLTGLVSTPLIVHPSRAAWGHS